MRLWLKDSERRADPAPVVTDDRKPFLVGTAVGVVGLTVSAIMVNGWWIWTCAAVVAIGVIGLVWSISRHRATNQ